MHILLGIINIPTAAILMGGSPLVASNNLWQFEVFLRVILLMQIVDITLKDNFKEGDEETEEHPDLHNFDAARVWQCIRDADEPVYFITKIFIKVSPNLFSSHLLNIKATKYKTNQSVRRRLIFRPNRVSTIRRKTRHARPDQSVARQY
jgi:hypothetical protein